MESVLAQARTLPTSGFLVFLNNPGQGLTGFSVTRYVGQMTIQAPTAINSVRLLDPTGALPQF